MEISGIKETCLYVSNIEQTNHFYHELLGLPLISAVENRHVFFRVGNSVLLCFIPETTKKEDTLPPHYAYGPQHIAFEVSHADYNKWKEKLADLGINITHEQTWPRGYKSFYFEDPDANVLEMVMPGMWD